MLRESGDDSDRGQVVTEYGISGHMNFTAIYEEKKNHLEVGFHLLTRLWRVRTRVRWEVFLKL